jgi:hypothetical protein
MKKEVNTMEKEKQVVTQRSEQKVHFQNGDKEVSNMENQKNKKIIIKRGENMKKERMVDGSR